MDLVIGYLFYKIFVSWKPSRPAVYPDVPKDVFDEAMPPLDESKNSTGSGTYTEKPNRMLIPLLYILNPYVLISSMSESFMVFVNLLIVSSIYLACRKKTVGALFMLAFATYLDIYPAFYIPGVLLILIPDKKRVGKVVWSLLLFGIFVGLLLYASYLLMNSWSFLNIYKMLILQQQGSVTTNLHWYISLEMFSQFQTFFPIVFFIFSTLFLVPYYIRFQDGVWVCLLVSGTIYCCGVLFLGTISILTPSSATDIALFSTFCLLAMHKGLVNQNVVFFYMIHFPTLILLGMISLGSMNGGKVNIVYGVGLALKVVEVVIFGLVLRGYTIRKGKLEYLYQ
jgi:hypothetical protein